MAWDPEPKELLEELLQAALQNLGASEKHSLSILLPNHSFKDWKTLAQEFQAYM